MYCQVNITSQWVSSFAAADFADWPGLCTYLAQFRILRFTFKGWYSSLTRLNPLQRSHRGKSLLYGNCTLAILIYKVVHQRSEIWGGTSLNASCFPVDMRTIECSTIRTYLRPLDDFSITLRNTEGCGMRVRIESIWVRCAILVELSAPKSISSTETSNLAPLRYFILNEIVMNKVFSTN